MSKNKTRTDGNKDKGNAAPEPERKRGLNRKVPLWLELIVNHEGEVYSVLVKVRRPGIEAVAGMYGKTDLLTAAVHVGEVAIQDIREGDLYANDGTELTAKNPKFKDVLRAEYPDLLRRVGDFYMDSLLGTGVKAQKVPEGFFGTPAL